MTHKLLILTSGAALGALALGLARLAALPEEHATHFHANFAVFVDGQRLDLSADRFMEDVSRCKADPTLMEPRDRVHLHNRDQDVVHVHADGVTWGHLFANLRMGLGERWLVTETGTVHQPVAGKSLVFVLNGAPIPDASNRAIRSKDRLLVSVGTAAPGDLVMSQFAAVKSNAGEFNEKFDPGACGSVHKPTLSERLRRAFWF